MEKFEKGERVKLSGTKVFGEVIDCDVRRNALESRSSSVLFVRVKHDDGKEMEYACNELKKA